MRTSLSWSPIAWRWNAVSLPLGLLVKQEVLGDFGGCCSLTPSSLKVKSLGRKPLFAYLISRRRAVKELQALFLCGVQLLSQLVCICIGQPQSPCRATFTMNYTQPRCGVMRRKRSTPYIKVSAETGFLGEEDPQPLSPGGCLSSLHLRSIIIRGCLLGIRSNIVCSALDLKISRAGHALPPTSPTLRVSLGTPTADAPSGGITSLPVSPMADSHIQVSLPNHNLAFLCKYFSALFSAAHASISLKRSGCVSAEC